MRSFSHEPMVPAGYGPETRPATLSESVAYSKSLQGDPGTRMAIKSLLENWRKDPASVEPLNDMRCILEPIRRMPPGHARAAGMIALLRALGTRESLSTYLAMIQDSARREGSAEQRLARISQDDANHCIYGWCGQTLLCESFEGPVEATVEPEDGLEEFIGCTTPEWGLAMHIWQTNPHARGFPSGKRPEPGALIEPPHTHPFDFASIVVAGEMHQTTYRQAPQSDPRDQRKPDGDRYAGVTLFHVDGVWPPHESRSERQIVTVEDRFRLAEGDAYFMPCDLIHDVEVDRSKSRSQPTITLFLSSEFMVRPHVYMARSLLDYQERNPTLRNSGRSLTHDAWQRKLTAVRRYLSGDAPELNLDATVDYDGEYAFIHQ